jgi:hypothetical protein
LTASHLSLNKPLTFCYNYFCKTNNHSASQDTQL